MPLSPGTRLGPYEVVAAAGAGGMGEVYKARDTRLERTVAIKVLPPSLAEDPEFKARFEREAKSISALNHPHICTLYDVGEQDGTSYLVMEHLEGGTLAERLQKGPLPVENALAIASQIADALDKAHRSGIVHRDLKPANVFLVKSLSASGAPHCKLLDFGLAKTGVPATSGTFETRLATSPPPSPTSPLTAQGTILGTFQYMSPEQIEGQEADARADIWAFGCVLYEMLTGRRAFEGKSQASLIASILERQPTPMAELQPMTPPALGRLVRTCLEKNPENRFHTAHDLWLHLQWIEEGGSAAGIPAPVIAGRRRRGRMLTAAAAAGAAALTGAAGWWIKPAPDVERIVTRFVHNLEKDQRFTRTGRRGVAISPDGTKIAFIANQQINLRHLNDLSAQPIRGTDLDPVDLTFSPDGESLAFFAPTAADGTVGLAGSSLRRIAITGGKPVLLCPADAPFGIRWQGDRIIFSLGRRILSVSENGGTPEPIFELPSGATERIAQPLLVQDGRALIFSMSSGVSFDDAQIVLQPLQGGERRVLVDGGTDGRVLSSGHLVWLRDGTLFAQRIDPATMTLEGVAVPVVEGVQGAGTGAAHAGISDTGTLVFRPSSALSSSSSELVWVDRHGRDEPTGAPTRNYSYARVSHDGSRIAAYIGGGDRDIWVWDLARRTMSKLTSGPENDWAPVWYPDSASIAYVSGPTIVSPPVELYRRAANGTGAPEQLGQSVGLNVPLMVLPSSRQALVTRWDSGTSLPRLFLWPLVADLKPERLLPESLPGQTNAAISPDGRWLAYQSREGSTVDEIHVRPLPDAEAGHWQITSDAGFHPVWSRTGHELFYTTGAPNRRLMRVEVHAGGDGAFSYGTPTPVLDATKYRLDNAGIRAFDLAPDDRRFLMVLPLAGTDDASQSLTVVTNWVEELKARVAAK